MKRRNKIVQEITGNVAYVFSCYAIMPSASVFNTSHGTWRMLMYEKPSLIHILMSILVWFAEIVRQLVPGFSYNRSRLSSVLVINVMLSSPLKNSIGPVHDLS